MVKKGQPRKMKSKRMTLKKKYKIEKKVKEHKRKVRRDARRNPKKVSKKDPGIPNLAPFKEAILREAEERKMKMQEVRDRKKARKKISQLEKMRLDAEGRQENFEAKKEEEIPDLTENKDLKSSRRAYFREVKRVVESADVLIEVLDARDPLGTRCYELEKEILASGAHKKLVLVLNKIDLVPRAVVEQWLKYLRQEFPTVAFKASTQIQRKHLAQYKYTLEAMPPHMLYSSLCLGANAVMKLLNNYCRSEDIKTSISVGVVGYPNVGKSSFINSLKRKKACNIGNTPGVTKSRQEVTLDKNIKLLDSPGVVLAKSNSEVTMVLRNCVKIQAIKDPVAPVEAILQMCNRDQLMLYYNLPQFTDTEEFLTIMANKKGRFKRGGRPNIRQAAKSVIGDWINGKIPFYTTPPEEHTLPSHLNAEIVSQFSKGFELSNIAQNEKKMFQNLSDTGRILASVKVESGYRPLAAQTETEVYDPENDAVTEAQTGLGESEMQASDGSDGEEGGEEKMERDEAEEIQNLENVTVGLPEEKSPAPEAKARGRVLKQLMEAKANVKATRLPAGNQRLDSARKAAFKKVLKKQRKTDKLATSLSDDLTKAMSSLGKSGDDATNVGETGDDYNINEMFS